jgi:UDP-2-acetamido-3-amino-2,3-dideoxy-glucuronate N-acetyltransferase
MIYTAHSSAIIDSGAKIGDDTKIWHFTHVSGSAKIGEHCSLGQNVFIGDNVQIGNNVKIQNNVSVYEEVILEDNVFCGPSMVFTNVYNPRSHLIRRHEFRKTHVKYGATIGANATIICGITLGEFAFIGAGSVVKSDVKAYEMIVGVPGKHVGWMCECGVRLQFSAEGNTATCKSCKLEYTLDNNGCRRK